MLGFRGQPLGSAANDAVEFSIVREKRPLAKASEKSLVRQFELVAGN
jgi:hypothetical protein